MPHLRHAVPLLAATMLLAGCSSPKPVAESSEPGTMPRDRQTFAELTRNNTKVRRTVHELPNGIESITESDDPHVAALITEHAFAMKGRVERGDGFRYWDPLFAAIFERPGMIRLDVTPTGKGVKVMETSDDAYCIKLIKAHSNGVDRFVEKGIDIISEPHELPAP
jgi:hypothetical protein